MYVICMCTQVPAVDIELNLVKNLLSSYKAQSGMAGPASNLYGVLGVSLPHDSADAAPPH